MGASASDKVSKTVFLDIGLMQHICGIPAASVLNQENLLDVYRGGLAEQFVGQGLLLNGGSENDKLYFWNRMKTGSSAEVDFLLVREGDIYPVEVKSGRPGRLKSMNLFLQEHPRCPRGIVLNLGNVHIRSEHNLKFMPLYTVLQFK